MFIALATAAVAMAGCQLKEEFTPEAERLVKGSFSIIDAETKSAAVTVTDEGDEIEAPETKTTLDTDGKSVKWSSTDRISVFDCLPRNRTFTLTSGAGSSSAQFDGLYADGTTVLYALYPQDSTATINGSVITTTIPATQNAVSGSFADKTNIAVGMAEPDPTTHAATTGMKNAAMYFKFKVPAAMTSLQSVTLTAGGNVKLVGQVSVDAAAESPAATVVSNGSSTITLTGISAGKTYYMVSAVTNLTSGFTITVTSSSETVTRTITKSFTGARGKVFDLSDLAFSANVSVGVAHNYDADNYLTGSTVTITPSFPDGGISSWSAKIYDKNGALVRTASGTTESITATTPATGKPYLPKSLAPYRIEMTCTTVNGSTIKKTNVGSISSSNIPDPTFSSYCNSTAYTSYNYYVDGEIDEANKLDGSTVYSLGGYCTIADAVLTQLNGKYYFFDQDEKSGSTLSSNSISKDSYKYTKLGQKKVGFNVIFDGITAKSTATTTVELTGIPHSADRLYDVRDEWSIKGSYDWNDPSYLDLGSGGGKNQTLSKTFHIPSTINVSTDYKIYFGGGYKNTTCTYNVGQTKIFEGTSSGYTMTKKISSTDAVFTTESNTVTVKNSYGLGTTGTEVYYLRFYYR